MEDIYNRLEHIHGIDELFNHDTKPPARESVVKCKVCSHVWVINSENGRPQRCPKCRTTRWDSELIKNECMKCGHSWQSSGKIPTKCPSCQSSTWMKRSDSMLFCSKCGHSWLRRGSKPPKKCPMCKSEKWGTPTNITPVKPFLMCNSDPQKWSKCSLKDDIFEIVWSDDNIEAKAKQLSEILPLDLNDSKAYVLYLEGSDLVSVSIVCEIPFQDAVEIVQNMEFRLFKENLIGAEA